MIGTTVKNKESLLFNNAKVFIGDSLSNITETDLILNQSHYIGAISNINLLVEKEYESKYSFVNGIQVLKEKNLKSISSDLILSFLEVTQENLNRALELTLTTLSRIEVVSVYPNKVSKLIGIFPKAQVTTEKNNFDLLSNENPMALSVTFSLLYPDVVEWADIHYGKFFII